jgi:uncharacterized repeat protein (TIGR03803 family)
MTSRKQEVVYNIGRTTARTSASQRSFGILCLILTAMTAVAQSEHSNKVKFTTLLNFDGTNGANPAGSLIQGRDGNLYGTTLTGGSNTNKICVGGTCGTLFKISPRGKLTTIYNFCSHTNCADGAVPVAPLVLSTDGDLYGITERGGNTGSSCPNASLGCGTVFKITTAGKLTTLYNWCSQPNCADGLYTSSPETNAFVQAADGNFYGTNEYGGNASNTGTAFKLTPNGALTTLYTFCSQTNCTDGGYPTGLIQAADGNFYGTTGGVFTWGTVFQLTPQGSLTTLYSFCSQSNCTDGAYPHAPLIQAVDGNFYGTTAAGGANENTLCEDACGTAFKITPKGVLTTLYNFCSFADCTDGSRPQFSLLQGSDRNFYGSTTGGDLQHGVIVFRLSSAGKLETLHTFDINTRSVFPQALFQATNGTFYGVTLEGGKYKGCLGSGSSCGTVFKLVVGLGPFVETVPTAGTVGEPVTLLGTDLSAATQVTFNHTAANFKVVSKTEIHTKVPVGATTGFVFVTTGEQRLKSNVKFQVLP